MEIVVTFEQQNFHYSSNLFDYSA